VIAAEDTIFAPSTGAGPAALSVIRISGPEAHRALRVLTGRPPPPPRKLVRSTILAADGGAIDDGMVVAFDAGASFTGEAMAEVHCHGSRAVVISICNRLESLDEIRLATPGEFTRRAFENHRIGLSQAEGLADLIAAETEVQRRQAVRLMSGGLAERTDGWRAMLLRALALVEVTIDWTEEDVPEDVIPEVHEIVAGLIAALATELALSERTGKLRAGYEIAIIGAPNAGKSTLLNTLAGRPAAITSDVPGTTRDVVEVRYDLGGFPAIMLDTAGLRKTADPVERIGVSRTEARAISADLRLHLCSADAPYPDHSAYLIQQDDLIVWTKSDLGPAPGDGECDTAISALRGDGIEALLDLIRARLDSDAAEFGLLGHLRQRIAVDRAATILRECLARLGTGDIEIVADDLRRVAMALDQFTGRLEAEDVLDEVFGAFCIGK